MVVLKGAQGVHPGAVLCLRRAARGPLCTFVPSGSGCGGGHTRTGSVKGWGTRFPRPFTAGPDRWGGTAVGHRHRELTAWYGRRWPGAVGLRGVVLIGLGGVPGGAWGAMPVGGPGAGGSAGWWLGGFRPSGRIGPGRLVVGVGRGSGVGACD